MKMNLLFSLSRYWAGLGAILAMTAGSVAQQPLPAGGAGEDRRIVPVHQHPHSHWILPFTRPMHPNPRLPAPVDRPVEVTAVDALIEINDQLATTRLDISLRNPNPRQVESEMILPVPDGSIFRGFSFSGTQLEATAKILPREEARQIYESIVAQTRDPALLEFVGTGLLQSSVFPVPAHGEQKVRVVFERLLPRDGVRIDYQLPRSETLDYRVPWDFTVKVRSPEPIVSLYSPSHELDVQRISPSEIHASVKRTTEPGSFQFSTMRQRGDGLTSSLIAYPDPKVGGGYFLLLMAPPASVDNPDAAPLRREVTIVLDRSGSMAGEKLEQSMSSLSPNP